MTNRSNHTQFRGDKGSRRRHCAVGAIASAAMFAAAALLASCGDSTGDGEGGQCQSCRAENPQCDSGLSCNTFRSTSVTYSLCSKAGTTQCEVPF